MLLNLTCDSPRFGCASLSSIQTIDLSVLLCSSFLPDVLGTASADTRCARHLRPFCFALFVSFLKEAHRHAVSVPPQTSLAAPFANPAKNFAVPQKSTFPSLGATSLAFLCPSTAG